MKNLRVYIDKSTHDIYEKLVKRGADNPDDFPFQTMKDLFMVAASTGAKHNQYEELKSSKDIFNADVFDEEVDIPVLASLAYQHEKKLVVLNDSKRILEIAQGYANGGIHLLKEELLNNPGRPLDNLIGMVIEN